MSTTYELKDGQVIPYTAGRRANDTRLWRDATDLELQQAETIAQQAENIAFLQAKLEDARGQLHNLRPLLSDIAEASLILAEWTEWAGHHYRHHAKGLIDRSSEFLGRHEP